MKTLILLASAALLLAGNSLQAKQASKERNLELPICVEKTDTYTHYIARVTLVEDSAVNGAPILQYDVEMIPNDKSQTTYIDVFLVRFTPHSKRYRVEERLSSQEYSYIDRNLMGMKLYNATIYSEEESGWVDKGYADKSEIYTLLLDYYLTLQANAADE